MSAKRSAVTNLAMRLFERIANKAHTKSETISIAKTTDAIDLITHPSIVIIRSLYQMPSEITFTRALHYINK